MPDCARPATTPSRIHPATSSTIAAAISACATLRRMRSRSERIFAITGSAERLERRAHEEREDVAPADVADEDGGQREAERDRRPRSGSGGSRARRAPSRGRGAGSARGRSRARSARAAGRRPPRPRRPGAPRCTGSGGKSQPSIAGRELAEDARPEDQAGGELAHHGGLPPVAHERAQRAGREDEGEKLAPEDEELMLARHALPAPPFEHRASLSTPPGAGKRPNGVQVRGPEPTIMEPAGGFSWPAWRAPTTSSRPSRSA